MAISMTLRTFVCLLVLAVFTLPVGPAPLASEATSDPSSEMADDRDFAEATAPSNEGSESSESEEGAACETIAEQIDDANTGPICHGILTCTFYVAGQAIALPFRLLGGALKIII